LNRYFGYKCRKTRARGATAIEYGLIASLISVAIIAASKSLGSNVSTTFSKVAANMSK
jgi:pilus assembly protein Flp/PilA